MTTTLRLRLGLALVLVLLSTAAFAQASGGTHAITVRVTDEHEGTPLPGATVVVENSDPAIGASSDARGLARLTGVASGAQTLVVSFVGLRDGASGSDAASGGPGHTR